MKIIDGKILSEEISEELRNLILSNSLKPHLGIIQVGSEKASEVYISNKQKLASKLGIEVSVYKFKSDNESEILSTINYLNKDDSVNGIIIQLPTPGLVNTQILEAIDPAKDVDGLTSQNLGNVWHNGDQSSLGATPRAILFVLEKIASELEMNLQNYLKGKTILIVNHSILIGKPLAGILSNYDATPIISNKFTENLSAHIQNSDIIISAAGTSILNDSNRNKLKQDVVIIDSGYRYEEGKTIGDVDLDSIKDKVLYATTVPGGIGPIGVAMLMMNVVEKTLNNH